MKRLGVIGGVSPQSTAIYYRLLNEAAEARLGPGHSIDAVFRMLDYGVMIDGYERAEWGAFRGHVAAAAQDLKAAGAEALVISSNTSHLAAEAAGAATGLPVIHLMDALVAAMTARDSRRPFLLGTPEVMAGDYYLPALKARYDGEVMTPDRWAQAAIGRIILNELVRGEVEPRSRDELVALVDRAGSYEADGVILGCTELCMTLEAADVDMPLFDTTALHVAAAARFAFGE